MVFAPSRRADSARWAMSRGGEIFAGAGVPTGAAGDAEIAAEIAAAQRDGEGGDEFEFVGDFHLGGEKARVRTGVAGAFLAGEAVGATVVSAEVAFA